MKYLILCFFIFLPTILAVKEWEDFKKNFGKIYKNSREENFRKNIFLENLDLINQHNKKFEEGRTTFKVGINKFADHVRKDHSNIYTPLVRTIPKSAKSFIPTSEVPDSIDWRDYGVITPVSNQELCNSCWAFAIVGTIEAHMGIYHQENVSLSQQNLVDCVDPEFTCDQSMERDIIERTYQYVTDNGGIDTYESYPREYYTVGECRYKIDTSGASIAGYANITEGDEEELKAIVGTIGPVTVAITTNWSFDMYVSGVFYDDDCMNTDEIFNHAVIVVGYGSEDGQDYWLVKNSWGTWFGEDGYIKMARNRDNNCGIASIGRYPLM